jgi:tetratricopeptide (TPR) repeat protein
MAAQFGNGRPLALLKPAAMPLAPQDQALFNAANDSPAISPETYNHLQAEAYKEKGNDFFLLRHYDMAIAEYLKSLYADPAYTDPYYNLGKIYTMKGDAPRSVEVYRRLLAITPQDDEVRVLLAQQYIKLGQYPEALAQYTTALAHNPQFDPARRALALLQCQLTAQQNPAAGQAAFIAASTQNIAQAKQLAKTYYKTQPNGHAYAALADKLSYQYATTQARNMGDNMSEYDHQDPAGSKPLRLVRFRPELAFANPAVTAAYLVHELVHALDNDAISSIMEEQDAYRHQARFWKAHRAQAQDPNLDMAANLYDKSVDLLDQEVRRSYSDDNLLPEKSPGHGLPTSDNGLIEYNREKLDRMRSYDMQRIKSLITG